ncbi:MAG: sigma 54-interacting transcriptional regulator [Polyangiaceae bacterium]
MPLADDTTLPPESLSRTGPGLGAPEAPALVLVWSREEPERAGEALVLPAFDHGAWTFGRDGGNRGPRAVRLVRQRPGENEPAGPLTNPRISRAQLEIRRISGGVAVKSLGRTPMLHGDREVVSADLAPGDTFEIRHEMVFLCVTRPVMIAAWEGTEPHPFGRPDALGIVGESPVAWALRRAVHLIARRSVHALVLGESGTGKEVIARAIHACSLRAGRPFIARSAATLPEGLLDAELFGSARGFPHAGSPERPGLIGEASGGTLFLDEIGELPETLQAHLLRVLDGGEYHRLGESRARQADLRLVAATNRPESALKHDVLARLTARIRTPSLGERREDIPLLARHLLRRQALSAPDLAERLFPGGDIESAPRLAPELIRALVAHRYTTHMRELDALLLAATLEGEGRYAAITPSVRRALSSPPRTDTSSSLAPKDDLPISAEERRGAARVTLQSPLEEPFSAEEGRRLTLLRAHGFRPSACARDPRYGANRQSADFHLRHLLARALGVTGYRAAAAEELLAGDDPALRERVHERMTAFLGNLRARLLDEGREALSRSLAAEWRGSSKAALDLVAALADGTLS